MSSLLAYLVIILIYWKAALNGIQYQKGPYNCMKSNVKQGARRKIKAISPFFRNFVYIDKLKQIS